MYSKFILTALVVGVCVLPAQEFNASLAGHASLVVQQARQARRAVTSGDRTGAIGQIDNALATVAEIRRQAPDSRMIAISGEVERETMLADVHASTHHETRLKKNSHVTSVATASNMESLDLSGAEQHLTAAKMALANNDTAKADAELAAVDGAVVKTSGSTDMPLMRAQQNLRMAKARVMEGNYKAAAAPLRAAERALDAYQRTSPGPHAVSAGNMRTEITAFANVVHDKPADAAERIDNWVAMVDSWAGKSMK